MTGLPADVAQNIKATTREAASRGDRVPLNKKSQTSIKAVSMPDCTLEGSPMIWPTALSRTSRRVGKGDARMRSQSKCEDGSFAS